MNLHYTVFMDPNGDPDQFAGFDRTAEINSAKLFLKGVSAVFLTPR